LPRNVIKGLNRLNPAENDRRDDSPRSNRLCGQFERRDFAQPGPAMASARHKMKTNVQRYGSVVAVKADGVARYKELHAAAWPAVLEIIKRSHIRNYSIYLRRLADGRHYLFSYLEYVGDDFTADMARIAAEPVTQRWWAECIPCLELLPDRAPGEVWSPMEEVFHLD
jgi:L-rhamnose mutarotase